MTHGIAVPLLLSVSTLLLCTAPAREKLGTDPEPVPAAHEKIWLAPLIDRSGVSDNITLPDDTAAQKVLAGHFEAINHKLLTEFRRCEKTGLYRMVTDSLQATMRVYVSLEKRIPAGDTLFIPLSVVVHSPSGNRRWLFNHTVAASVPRPVGADNAFHHAGRLIMSLGNAFPYRQVVHPFHKQ